MAIKIIKEGDRSKSKVMQFTCKNCGCVFECDHDEIHNNGVMCPTCWNGISLFDSDTYIMAINNMAKLQKVVENIKDDMDKHFDRSTIVNHIKENWNVVGIGTIKMPDTYEIRTIVCNMILYAVKSKSKQIWENFEATYTEQNNTCSVEVTYTDGNFKVSHMSTVDMLTAKIV